MHVNEIGGKAASLLQLQKIVSVKPFVTISVEAVRDIQASGRVSGETRRQVLALRNDCLYAVRSSAAGEDGKDISWAGQFKTTLHVPQEDLLREIVSCALSYDSEMVRAYAEAHNADAGGLALIVQEMVNADCAGVLFTRDPRSGISMVVEACQGTADQLVSGLLTPTRYYMDPKDGRFSRSTKHNFELSDHQLVRLFETARLIRENLGHEVDIEWAFDKDGTLYINQSRPITGLVRRVVNHAELVIGQTEGALAGEQARLAALGFNLEHGDVLSNQNVAELLQERPTRMAHGLFCHLFAHGDAAIKTGRNTMGYEIGSELDAGFHVLVGGQPRVSIVHDALSYRIRGIPLADYALIVQDYLEKIADDESLANYPEVGLYQQHPSIDHLECLFGAEKAKTYAAAYEEFFAGIRRLEHALRHVVADDFLPDWRGLIGHLQQHRYVENLSVGDAVAQYRLMCDLLRTRACRMFVQVARLGFFAYARARDLLIVRFGKETGTEHFNTLLGTSSTTSPNFRFSRALFELKETGDLENVMREFGHLAAHELEISVPRYSEQPEVLKMLASKAVDPATSHARGLQKANELEAHLAERFSDTWAILLREIEVARTYLELRELVKFEYLKGYDLLRRLAVQIEAKLGWDKGLIFDLDPTEVFQLANSSEELKWTALKRADERRSQSTLFVPSVVFGDNLVAIGRAPSLDTSRCLYGIGVTNEVAEGICVVVSDLSDTATLALVRPGSILVTVNSDPAWSPVFKALGKTGGVITEIGGLLAHAATCAREDGIAAVLNVPNATLILKTGMRVRVDGPSGIVEILPDV